MKIIIIVISYCLWPQVKCTVWFLSEHLWATLHSLIPMLKVTPTASGYTTKAHY